MNNIQHSPDCARPVPGRVGFLLLGAWVFLTERALFTHKMNNIQHSPDCARPVPGRVGFMAGRALFTFALKTVFAVSSAHCAVCFLNFAPVLECLTALHQMLQQMY
ncbi:hypothetical protein KI387_041054, partial [Taxus chinensis]